MLSTIVVKEGQDGGTPKIVRWGYDDHPRREATKNLSRDVQSVSRTRKYQGITRINKGLKVQSGIDTNTYKKGIKVTDSEIAELSLTRDEWHGEWNYVISPQN